MDLSISSAPTLHSNMFCFFTLIIFALLVGAIPTIVFMRYGQRGHYHARLKRFASFCMVAALGSGLGIGIMAALQERNSGFGHCIGVALIAALMGTILATPSSLAWLFIWQWASKNERANDESLFKPGDNDNNSA